MIASISPSAAAPARAYVSRDEFLPAVDPNTRDLNYTSVSAIAKANPKEYGGCERRWWYRYVLRLSEPQMAHQEAGVKVHAQLEHYLKTGQDVLGNVAREGVKYLPEPGKDLLVEWGLNDKPKPPSRDGKDFSWFPPSESLLKADGVPLIGFIDVVSPRSSVEADPEWAFEVLDHKTTSNLKWAKRDDELLPTTQMAGYGMFGAVKYPEMTHARLSHVYYQTGRKDPGQVEMSCKASVLVPVATVKERWYEVESVVRRMKETAKIENASEVPQNLGACEAWKGCPFQRNCFKSPMERFKMGLLAKVTAAKNNGVATAAAVASVTAPVVAAPVAQVAKKTIIHDELRADQATQGKSYLMPDGSTKMFLCLMNGKCSFLSPVGGSPTILDPGDAIYCEATAAPTPPASPQVVAQAALPPALSPPPVAMAPVAAPPWMQPAAQLPWGPPPPPPQAEAPAKRKPGRPRKDAAAETAPAVQPPAAPAPVAAAPAAPPAQVAPPPVAQAAPPPAPVPALPPVAQPTPPPPQVAPPTPQAAPRAAAPAPQKAKGLSLFVNCVPSDAFKTLDQYVWSITELLQKQFNVIDIRCPTEQNSNLGFGKWKGVVAAAVRASPPEPGVWVAFTRGNEITEAVIEALVPHSAFVARGV